MHEPALLRDLVILFAAALPIVVVFQRLRMPSVVGFLIAGIFIGPYGIGLIPQSSDVDSLAELGLVLLLFVVGLELSFSKLLHIGRVLVLSGTLQVVLTAALTTAIAVVGGVSLRLAVFLGFLIVHSSTAIVLKLLADRHELDAPHGRLGLGVLLIQDLSLVPMMLLTRVITSPESGSWQAIALVLLKAAGALAIIVTVARMALPAMLRQVVRLRSRELFTGTIVVVALGAAWMAAGMGLSLALGALIAGLVISESEYSHQVVADILPFRDTFNSIFFLSVGMLVQPSYLFAHFAPLIGATLAVVAFKAILCTAILFVFARSLRVSIQTALCLAPLGELAFALARFAAPSTLMSDDQYQAFVTTAVLSMLAAPFLIAAAPQLAATIERWMNRDASKPAAAAEAPPHRVVIIGYGLNGENLANVLRATGIPYTILELDPQRLKAARERGEPVQFGDATRLPVLEQAGVASAPVIVVAISDPGATRRIVALLRTLNDQGAVLVRTRYVAEIDELRRLGATEVVPEEFETSVEIFARVLRRLHVPRNIINIQIDLIRRSSYGMLRGLDLPRETLDQLGDILAATTTESFLVTADSPAVGQSLRDLRLRKVSGATVIAAVRDRAPQTNPPPEFEIRAGDILVMLGSHAQLDRAIQLLQTTGDGEADP
ncbi:MAG: cation:proton antiporter [Deltaproteobacteria bacterium]|nr:cation:proton antiporter [Deltaproteobacteria bacterium]